MVGAKGFEPLISCSQNKRSVRGLYVRTVNELSSVVEGNGEFSDRMGMGLTDQVLRDFTNH